MKLLLAGASGLVGREPLRQALEHPGVSRVIAPTRQALAPAPRLDNPLVDFERLPERVRAQLGAGRRRGFARVL